MTERRTTCAVLLVWAAALGACSWTPPGQPAAEPEVPDPRTVTGFAALYGQNCAGCHGEQGKGGAALGLGAPGYLAIVPDAAIRKAIVGGIPGTAMPAFARSAGGMLTDAQVDALVAGVRAWAPADVRPDPATPPYQATAPGDPRRGAQAFRDHCGSCHGADGRGGPRAGSIADGAFLALVSDQSLRTTILAGRPDVGSPDFRTAGRRAMSAEDVSDTVAWLVAQRERFPGQPYPNAKVEGSK